MNDTAKTHFKKAFNSPYLSSSDIVGDELLTISHVVLEPDKTKKTKDSFNTAYFKQKEIRPGEALKPMILNVTNSKMVATMTNTPFIENWINIPVIVFVDHNVKMMGSTVEGLRIRPAPKRKVITKSHANLWKNAKNAYLRDGNFDSVLLKADISEENQLLIINECANV